LILLDHGFVLATVGEAAWDEIGSALADDPGLADDLTRFLCSCSKAPACAPRARADSPTWRSTT
jgi:hypothetical protein